MSSSCDRWHGAGVRFAVRQGICYRRCLAAKHSSYSRTSSACEAAHKQPAIDGIFPPAATAKPFIDFDGRGFLVNGKRTFLASGSLHYARVPRELWRDRLLRMKRAGFNTVQTYLFWNFQEPQEGKWDFSGNHDLNAFLKLVKQMGMYATVRVGPYVCAEWDSGGFPVWLRFKPGLKVRTDNPAFEAAVDDLYDHMLPIVAANQINHGGAVVLVQLENEDPQGWGTEIPNDYFRHLQAKAIANGIQVLYFFSGLHHGSDPGGDTPWPSAQRTIPWYTTEFWPGWAVNYGDLNAGDLRKYDRGTWKIIAYGGNGYNYYMLCGGSNFETWNDDEVAASYDYSAAIGQTGALRPIYYRFKRAAYFATSFPSVLEDSDNATDAYKSAATSPDIRVTARKSPAGTILFLDNNSNKPVQSQVKGLDGVLYPTAGPLTVDAGQIVPIVTDYRLLPDVTLQMAAANILGIASQGATTTVVIYGPPGDPAELRFRTPSGKVVKTQTFAASGSISASGSSGEFDLKVRFGEGKPGEATFEIGAERLRVLAVSTQEADHTWFVDVGGATYVIAGPEYVGDVNGAATTVSVEDYKKYAASAPDEVVVYGPAGNGHILSRAADAAAPNAPTVFNPPALGAWEARSGSAQAASDYADTRWLASQEPLQMGADGDYSAYAWYRTTITPPAAGTYTLNFSDAGDWISVFVNGKHAASSKIQERDNGPIARHITVTLPAGPSALAVLAAHYGRNRLLGIIGPIDKIYSKGVCGPVALSRSTSEVSVTTWRWKSDANGEGDAAAMTGPGLDTSGAGWNAGKIGEDIFHGQRGFAWFRAILPAVTGDHHQLHFESVDDNATVYLNGSRLAHHEGWTYPFDVSLDSAWKQGAPNNLVVLVENVDGGGGIMGDVKLTISEGDQPVRGWKMQGGLGAISPDQGWSPAADAGATANAGAAMFYRTVFNSAPPTAAGLHPILRVSLNGMSRGFVWLNGHNLGRYPERVPVDGVYLPECWLKNGDNSLVVFDEEGNTPAGVKIVVEADASRTITQWSAAGAKDAHR